MNEKVQNLYTKLKQIAREYLLYQKKDNFKEVKEIIPEIHEFVLWFLEEKRFDVGELLYQEMARNLVCVLEDILEAIQENDCVLMHDALAYGLMEYLEIFAKREDS